MSKAKPEIFLHGKKKKDQKSLKCAPRVNQTVYVTEEHHFPPVPCHSLLELLRCLNGRFHLSQTLPRSFPQRLVTAEPGGKMRLI